MGQQLTSLGAPISQVDTGPLGSSTRGPLGVLKITPGLLNAIFFKIWGVLNQCQFMVVGVDMPNGR